LRLRAEHGQGAATLGLDLLQQALLLPELLTYPSSPAPFGVRPFS
jgi:hypothetical protein